MLNASTPARNATPRLSGELLLLDVSTLLLMRHQAALVVSRSLGLKGTAQNKRGVVGLPYPGRARRTVKHSDSYLYFIPDVLEGLSNIVIRIFILSRTCSKDCET